MYPNWFNFTISFLRPFLPRPWLRAVVPLLLCVLPLLFVSRFAVCVGPWSCGLLIACLLPLLLLIALPYFALHLRLSLLSVIIITSVVKPWLFSFSSSLSGSNMAVGQSGLHHTPTTREAEVAQCPKFNTLYFPHEAISCQNFAALRAVVCA